MSTLRVRTGLHRLTAAMSVLVFALIGVVGASPASAAPGSGSMKVTSAYQIDIHKNETVDLTITMEMEGISPSIYCTQDMKDSLELQNQPNATTDLNTDGNQCIMSIKGAEISKMKNDDSMRIEHKGSKFIFSASDFSSMEETDATMSVTFPGKVTKADSKAKTNGNTVTWSDLSSLNSISAEGKDSPGPSWVWIIVGVLVVIAIGGGITAAIVLTNRKKKQLGAPAGVYSQPQMPGQPGQPMPGQPMPGQPSQPGYAQPGQPMPGQPGYSQPGQPMSGQPMPGQPGYAQPGQPMPGQPGYSQPGQQPYNPNQQY